MDIKEAKERATDALAKSLLDAYKEACKEKEHEHNKAMYNLRQELVRSIAKDILAVISKVGMSPLFISQQEIHRVFIEKYGLSKHETFE